MIDQLIYMQNAVITGQRSFAHRAHFPARIPQAVDDEVGIAEIFSLGVDLGGRRVIKSSSFGCQHAVA